MKETTNTNFLNFSNNGHNGVFQKQKDKRFHLRWVATLIISNILVLLLAREVQPKPKISMQLPDNRKDHKRLILPIKSFLPIKHSHPKTGFSIELYTPDKKLLISKAYLYPNEKKPISKQGIAKYQVDIPHEHLHLLLPYLDSHLLAYPQTDSEKRKINYEIVF